MRKPEVGMPATIKIGSDSYPAVVTKFTPKTISVRHIKHSNNHKVWPEQEFETFIDQPEGEEIRFWLNSKNQYKNGSSILSLGYAVYYQDPSF